MEQRSHPTRIAIVGCGNVGATYAYALLLKRSIKKTLLDKKQGHVLAFEDNHGLVKGEHSWRAVQSILQIADENPAPYRLIEHVAPGVRRSVAAGNGATIEYACD